MKEEIKRDRYKGYLITVHENKTSKKGRYHVHGRNFTEQTSPPEAAMNLPSYHYFGDNPDDLIDRVKETMDENP